jgi:hypothetical protein
MDTPNWEPQQAHLFAQASRQQGGNSFRIPSDLPATDLYLQARAQGGRTVELTVVKADGTPFKPLIQYHSEGRELRRLGVAANSESTHRMATNRLEPADAPDKDSVRFTLILDEVPAASFTFRTVS